MGALAWLLVAVPLGTGAVLACTGRRGDRVAPATGIVAAAVTLVLAIFAAGLRPAATAPLLAGIDASVAVDGLSAILVVTVAAVTLAVLLFAAGEPGLGSRFAGLMLLFAGAMLVTVIATGLVLLLMGWEVMGATSWALIGFWWREPRRVRAANVAFLTTRGADLGLYLTAGAALAGGAGSLELAELPAAAPPWLALLTAGIVLAAVGKSAQLPFSFMVLAAGAGGVAGGTMQLVAHAATKSALFLAAGAWLTALGTKALPALRGAARRHPLVGITFTVAAASLAGLPPLSLWVAKDEVLAAALERSPALYAAGLAAAVISGVYSVKAVWFVWQPEPAGAQAGWDVEQPGTREVAAPARPALVALAAAAALLGLLGLPPLVEAIKELVGATGEASPAAWELVASAVLALAAASAAWWWGGRPVPVPAPVRRALGEWLRLERAADLLAVRPTMALARVLAAFDDRALHRTVLAVPAAGLWLARLSERRAELSMDNAVGAIVRTVRRLAALARRPQTGQLHQYYAQAAVALVVLALLVVFVR
ncbi:MAG: proton-conducting transporter membrane subunit [Pseudonocardiaceae bacterium]